MGHADVLLTNPLSSAEAPAGYPFKDSNNRKNRKRAWDDGKREKAGDSLSPSHRAPRALSFFLPNLPTTHRGLCGGESDEPLRTSAWEAIFMYIYRKIRFL